MYPILNAESFAYQALNTGTLRLNILAKVEEIFEDFWKNINRIWNNFKQSCFKIKWNRLQISSAPRTYGPNQN